MAASRAKHTFRPIQKLIFPLLDLIGMQVNLNRQLVQSLLVTPLARTC